MAEKEEAARDLEEARHQMEEQREKLQVIEASVRQQLDEQLSGSSG